MSKYSVPRLASVFRAEAISAGLLSQELLAQDAFFQVMLRVEQQGQADVAVFSHGDVAHVADLAEVGDGADRRLPRSWVTNRTSEHGG